MSAAVVVLSTAAATQRFIISCPIAFVNLSLPLVSLAHAGGECTLAIDRLANPSRVPRQEFVKSEAPPAAVTTPCKTLEASTIDVLAPLDASRTKAALGGRVGGAEQHCLLLQSERAINQPLGTSLRDSTRIFEAVVPTPIGPASTDDSFPRLESDCREGIFDQVSVHPEDTAGRSKEIHNRREGPALRLLLLTIVASWLLLAACRSYVVARPSSRRDVLTALLLLLAAQSPRASAQAIQVAGRCSLTDGGSCAASPNYPNSYGENEACTISGVPPVRLETVAFDVEGDYYLDYDFDGNGDPTDDCPFDYLTVNGTRYCGTSGPSGAVAEDGVIEWVSDDIEVRSGWKVCWAVRPPSPPPSSPSPPLSPPSPPASPPMLPPPPAPPASPPPPAPPLSPGFDVAAASEDELRDLITEAAASQADVSIYLPPSARFELGSQIICSSSIKVTVASSGEGATLDGQGETGLFLLRGGCSLTLRVLTLVNGRAFNGGVVEAQFAGDVEIIDATEGGVVRADSSGAVSITGSTVTSCSAREGGVVRAFDSGVVSIIGSTVTSCSAAEGGGVVWADDSGAVSIIGSNVTGCSAGELGGVVYALYINSLSIAGVDFIDNGFNDNVERGADGSGSVLYLQSTPSSISDASFTGNSGITIQTINSPIDWDCRLGRWMPIEGALTGDFSAPECNLCSAGYYGSTSGLTDPTCDGPCDRGKFCPAGTAEPLPCAPGFYMPVTGAASAESCIPCTPGTSQSTAGAVRSCDPCPPGTFADQLNATGCSECPAGSFCPNAGTVQPLDCAAGQYQNLTGQAACTQCPAGEFQAERGQTSCDLCAAGGYCDDTEDCGGGFAPCKAGTYNERPGSSSPDACQQCPPGTSSPTAGAVSSETCASCRAGTFGDEPGQSECTDCPAGSYSNNGSRSCDECDVGYYAANRGQGQCVPCPYPLSSESGAVTCSICKKDFYLKDATALPDDVFQNPTEYCKPCPPNANCSAGTALDSLGVDVGYWRASNATSELHRCESETCAGYVGSGQISRRHRLTGAPVDPYCTAGHTGPLCEVCVADSDYFSSAVGRCVPCPSTARSAGVVVIFVIVIAVLAAAYAGLRRLPISRRLRRWVTRIESEVGLQPKFKVIVSFYQVSSTLGVVYGVRLDERFTRWLDVLKLFSLDLFDVAIPGRCIGAMSTRLLVAGLWPYAAVALVSLAIVAVAAVLNVKQKQAFDNLVGRVLYWAIFIFYLALPSVSRSVFSARLCESFGYDDDADQRISFLLADPSLTCDEGPTWDDETSGLAPYFWAFFALWPVLVPLGFLALLLRVRKPVAAQRATPLTRATSFLWRDYSAGFLFWEVLDLLRKIFLTSMVLFIDQEYGSVKLQRLVVAAIVSAMFLTILALARPYRRSDDLGLACVANLLLTCCFASGVVIQLCDSTAYEGMCYTLVGYKTSRGATTFVVVLTAVMLAVSLAVILVSAVSAARAKTMRLASSKREPMRDGITLADGQQWHLFLSHVWSTGQDAVAVIKNELQQFLPGCEIFLDIDDLKNIGELEAYIGRSQVVLCFLSRGYLRSTNCLREIRAALEKGKPLVLVHEADPDKGGGTLAELRSECPEELRAAIFDAGWPMVVWHRIEAFQHVSLKVIAEALLLKTPKYENEKALPLCIPGELQVDDLAFPKPVVLWASTLNDGARGLANAVAAAVAGEISVTDATPSLLSSLPRASGSGGEEATHMLLYLKKSTWAGDGAEALAEQVRAAREARLPIVVAHENDAVRGGCIFAHFFEVTPRDLIADGLYHDLAVGCHADPHRQTSIALLAQALGATKQTAQSRVRRVTALARTTQPRGGSSKAEQQEQEQSARDQVAQVQEEESAAQARILCSEV